MQQNSELIEWAKERCRAYLNGSRRMTVAEFINDILLPKLEGCKTSPNKQSTQAKSVSISPQFATCERKRALGYIQAAYPSKKIEDTPESAGALLDFVEGDVVRIQDPEMYGKNIQVVPGKNWVEEKKESVVAACAIFNCPPEVGPTSNAQHESAETKTIESAPSCVR